jgi:hypothetical protein
MMRLVHGYPDFSRCARAMMTIPRADTSEAVQPDDSPAEADESRGERSSMRGFRSNPAASEEPFSADGPR